MKLPESEMSVSEYYEQIRKAQSKIQQIQAKCLHLVFEIHMYMWRPGAMQPQRICKACNKVLHGITEEETKNAWEEWKIQIQSPMALADTEK